MLTASSPSPPPPCLRPQHNFEKQLLRCSWSRDGRRVAAGSADRTVCVWDAADAKLLYKLPGHQGTVLQVRPLARAAATC